MASRSSAKQQSIVWKFLKISDDNQNKSICQLCNKQITRGTHIASFTTTNMLKHLHTQHRKDLQKEKDEKRKEEMKRAQPIDDLTMKRAKIVRDSFKQQTLHDIVAENKTWDINDRKAQRIHRYIGEMIAIDLQPFSVVEDLGFKRLLKHICPNYIIPSRKYIKENIVHDIYRKVRNKIQEEINTASYVSLTSDGWSVGIANLSFLSVTSHWINENFEQRSAVLRITPFKASHTAVNISEIIKNAVEEFDISCKIHVLIRDNAANMAAATVQTNYSALPCFLHTLQLTLNDAIFTQRFVKVMISVCKQIVGHFNHSPAAFAKYQEYQKKFNLPNHRFIQDVNTRWNSQYAMLSRVFEQKNALISYCSEHVKPHSLESNQWKMLEKILKILKQFNECTNVLSSREATASYIIPQIKVIHHFFKRGEDRGLFHGLDSTLSAWKTSFNARFNNYLQDKNLILATYLDPRFKSGFLENNYSGLPHEKAITEWLTQDIYAITKEKIDTSPNVSKVMETDVSDVSVEKSDDDNDFNFSFEKCLTELKKKDKEKVEPVKNELDSEINKQIYSLKIEMEKYQKLKNIKCDDYIFQWWNSNKYEFPILASLTRKYLSAPPSSVESERLFSIGGNIYLPSRNRLKGETGEMLMFLHYNLRILGLKYE